MNLTIDIGNTRTKIIIFDGEKPVYEESVSEDLEKTIERVCSRFRPQQCAWCNVGESDTEIAQMIKRIPCTSLQLTGLSEVPLKVCYKTRATLGADRLAAVLGATALHPETDLLIIDAGTCITYDLVDSSGTYLGGNISPGIEMRFKALHQFTARLPHIEATGELPFIGNDTETAIRCGVINGITHEIEGYAALMQKKYPNIKVFLTGGSHFDFTSTLKDIQLSDPYLVARGLNRLLNA